MRVKVKGMSCQHCVSAVTQALQQVEGIANVEVSLDKGEARFEEDKQVDREAVRKAVQDAGYEAAEFEQ
ncbi:MAG: cation transporter [Desulfohalobiaceae bacterium]